jgi:hypothetical protein
MKRAFLVRYMEDRFGIPTSEFHDCVFFKHQQSWWMVKNTSGAPLPRRLKVTMVGLKAFQKVGSFHKTYNEAHPGTGAEGHEIAV